MVLSRPLSSAVIALTTFQLGALLQNWAYDHRVLWESSTPSERALSLAQAHYTALSEVPHAVQHTLHTVFALSLLALIVKLYKANDSNKLFDGATLLLVIVSIAAYKSNFIAGVQAITAEAWGPLGRTDTIKVVAASNVILAIILFGIIGLQIGQRIAEQAAQKELVEIDRYNAEQRRRSKSAQSSPAADKVQQAAGEADGSAAAALAMAQKGADSGVGGVSTASTPSKARKRRS